MNQKFRNKYRIPSHRMPGWDYSGDGLYFITLVIQHRICYLGEILIIDGRKTMTLSDWGNIVQTEWEKSFKMRDEIIMDEYIIMPNHLHAIVGLEKRSGIGGRHVVETHGRASLQGRASLPSKPSNQPPFHRQSQSISSFIAGFKSAVNGKIDNYIDHHQLDIPKFNRHNHFFQPNYHDRVIRNEQEYARIKNYIINNPEKWNEDHFNPLKNEKS
jgi:REP element-mobilizing transposase RayT